MKINDYYYLDVDTFVAVFNNQTDEDGDVFKYEVEFHEDEKKWCAVKVYDHELVDVSIDTLPNGMLEMAKDARKECLYKDFTESYTKEDISRLSKRDNESPFGVIIGIIRDCYGIPKPDGFDLAEKIEKFYTN